MEIFEEEDEEVKQLMIRISKKEITLCETCDTFFDYVPQKNTCDECQQRRRREYDQRPEVIERKRQREREYRQRPEVKERIRQRGREWRQRPEVRERKRQRQREYRQRPEVIERRRKQASERYHRLKKLREEE